MKKFLERRGWCHRSLMAGILFTAVGLALTAAGSDPAWWAARGIKSAGPASDFSIADQGQAKWFAAKAAEEFALRLPPGPPVLGALPAGDNFAPINQGQLKTLVAPFYDQIQTAAAVDPRFLLALPAMGMGSTYPWTDTPNDDTSYAPVNIGQLKNVFSFDFDHAVPGVFLWNVDFQGLGSSPKVGPAAVGQGTGDQWNSYSMRNARGETRSFSGSLNNLVKADGVPTPVSLEIFRADSSTLNGSPDPMYNSVVTSSQGSIDIIVKDLPTGPYTIYLYSDDGNFSVSSSVSGFWGSGTTFDSAPSNPGQPAWEPGRQYTAISGTVSVAGETVTINVAASTGVPRISGLQILRNGLAGGFTVSPLLPSVQSVTAGSSVNFNAITVGTPPDSYQWFFNVINPLATTPTLPLPVVQPNQSGSYQVKVNNTVSLDGASATTRLNVWTQVAPASSPLWNVDFGAGTTSLEQGSAAIGKGSGDFWNQPNGASVTDYPLKNSNQQTTPVTITLADFDAGSGTTGASDAMYSGYIAVSANPSGTITVKHLPPGVYEVYLYSFDGNFFMTAGSSSASLATSDPQVSDPQVWQVNKQYVHGQLMVESVGQDLVVTVFGFPFASISGLQIVAGVPDISIASDQNPACSQSLIVISAHVGGQLGSFPQPTGTVQFRLDGNNFRGPVTLDDTSSAHVTMIGLAPGPHTITAVYSGDVNYIGAISTPFTQDISPSPTITGQPAGASLCAGSTATFTVTAAGPSFFRWRRNGAALVDGTTTWGSVISGARTFVPATSSTLTLESISFRDAASYDVAVVDATTGCVTISSTAKLTLGDPTIIGQTLQQTVVPGSVGKFSVTVNDTGTSPTYHWFESTDNGGSFHDAPGTFTSRIYTSQPGTLPTVGNPTKLYRCQVTGPCGSPVTSVAAPLNVQTTINDGKPVWTHGMVPKDVPNITTFVDSSPAIANDGTIYVYSSHSDNLHPCFPPEECSRSTAASRLHALNPDGTEKWAVDLGPFNPEITSSPAIGSDGTIYATSENHLYAFNPSGVQQWVVELAPGDWNYETGPGEGGAFSPALAADGTIYVTTDDLPKDALYAVNPSGQIKWAFAWLEGFPDIGEIDSAPSVGPDGTVYFVSEEIDVVAVSSQGDLKWSLHLPIPSDSPYTDPSPSPSIDTDINTGDTIYVGFTAISPPSTPGGLAQLKWRFQLPPGVKNASSATIGPASSPVAPNGVVYCVDDHSTLYAIDRGDHHLLWSRPTGSGSVTRSTPAVGANGTVYFGAGDNQLYGVIPPTTVNGTPTLRPSPWPLPTGGPVLSSPTIGPGNTVYVGSQDGNVYAVLEHNSLGSTIWPAFRKNLKHTAGP